MEGMSKEEFEIILDILASQVVLLAMQEYPASNKDELSKEFHSSKVYSLLSDKITGVWRLSPPELFDMFKSEKETGVFHLPKGI